MKQKSSLLICVIASTWVIFNILLSKTLLLYYDVLIHNFPF